MNNKIHLYILILIFIIAFVLRFFKLGEVPYGFYQDESAIGYNAYSILETGKDEHGQFLPLYFKSFGDYKLPIYIYATAASVKIFGMDAFAVRFPSALFGFLTVIVFYFFVKQITGNKNLSLVATAFLAINPWHIHYNRATFEVSISLFLFVLGGLFFHVAFIKRRANLFFAGLLCFVLSLYSYNLTRLLSPLLFIIFIYYYREYIKIKIRKLTLLKAFIPVVLLVPFFLTLFNSGGVSSAGGTLIFSSAVVQAPILELRSYIMNPSLLFAKLFFNHIVLTFWQYLNNVAAYFSPYFYFISGSSHGNHGIGNIGQFYLFELPLGLIGIYAIIRSKMKWGLLMFYWATATILVAALTRDVPHATRSFFLIVPFEVIFAYGFFVFFSWVKTLKKKEYSIVILSAAGIFIFYNVVFYLSSYYFRFPVLYAKQWKSEDKTVSYYLQKNQEKYDHIIFDENAGFIYTSYLFYTKYSPSLFQKTAVYEPDDSEGFSKLRSFGKYEFRSIDWNRDMKLEKTLIITQLERKPENIPPLEVFYYPKRPVYFAVKQEIVGYPVEESAYVLVETK